MLSKIKVPSGASILAGTTVKKEPKLKTLNPQKGQDHCLTPTVLTLIPGLQPDPDACLATRQHEAAAFETVALL